MHSLTQCNSYVYQIDPVHVSPLKSHTGQKNRLYFQQLPNYERHFRCLAYLRVLTVFINSHKNMLKSQNCSRYIRHKKIQKNLHGHNLQIRRFSKFQTSFTDWHFSDKITVRVFSSYQEYVYIYMFADSFKYVCTWMFSIFLFIHAQITIMSIVTKYRTTCSCE
jgi:hypothetical protein